MELVRARRGVCKYRSQRIIFSYLVKYIRYHLTGVVMFVTASFLQTVFLFVVGGESFAVPAVLVDALTKDRISY